MLSPQKTMYDFDSLFIDFISIRSCLTVRKLYAILILTSFAMFLTSCSTVVNHSNDEEEVKEILRDLIPRALHINATFNGSGTFKEDKTQTIPGEEDYALVVDEKIQSLSDLKRAVEDVYTKQMAQERYYSRYIDVERPLYKEYEGRLYVDTRNGGHGWATEFVIDTAKIKRQHDHVVEIELEQIVYDDPDGTITIKIENVDGKWLMASSLD